MTLKHILCFILNNTRLVILPSTELNLQQSQKHASFNRFTSYFPATISNLQEMLVTLL
jgi:hypothetical protein